MSDIWTPPTPRPGPPAPSRPWRANPATARTERYRVPGRGSVLIQVDAGDRLEIVNREGGQSAVLAGFTDKGTCDETLFGAQAEVSLASLPGLLNDQSEEGARLRSALKRRGIELAHAKGLALFSATTPAGSSETLIAERPAVALIAAPAEAMDPHGQNTASEIGIVLTRTHNRARDEAPPLPEPLADPLLDLRVHKRTAESFVVRAGEFIQVLDVAGRQCSDFQAFDARLLEKGIEREIDLTATRTLMGAAYPLPGLHAKYFAADMQPMVEVIRDTVGRHDTYGYACTARYYEDQGYPAHTNCSQNMSNALAPYGVAPRAGWPAMNFFYNTAIDETNAKAWYRRGQACMALSQFGAARKDLTRAAKLAPASREVRDELQKAVEGQRARAAF